MWRRMMNKIKSFVLKHLKLILAVAIPVVIIAIIFAIPFLTVAVPVTEKYWETVIQTEPYTDTETYTDMEAYVTTETRTETVVNQAVGYGGWTQSFKVAKADSTVTIEVNNYGGGYYQPRYFIMGDNNHSPFYSPGSPWSSWYGGWDNWGGGQSWATVRVNYPEEVTKFRPAIKTREVTRYREVPTQVMKERTVIENVRMSVWQSMFR
jgi:hypothetical protein